MVIHIIGTVTGQTNEGMRNIATHLASAFEKENTVLYSGLKQLPQIVPRTLRADATLIFARANRLIYSLTRIVGRLCKNTWIVLVQRPDTAFLKKCARLPLPCSYLAIAEDDMLGVPLAPGREKRFFPVGIDSSRFTPVSLDQKRQLKQMHGFDPYRPLVVHVGHCSTGRGLEDFSEIQTAQSMVVSSGMFEDEHVVRTLKESGVTLHTGYLAHVEEIYQMADAYFFPTKSTEFVISIPLSVMEALSCGVPVIGYSCFENLDKISAEAGAITRIDYAGQVDHVLPALLRESRDRSLLKAPCSWDAAAQQVLKILRENQA